MQEKPGPAMGPGIFVPGLRLDTKKRPALSGEPLAI